MQLIQPILGIKVKPLGIRKPLGDSHRLLLKRESSYLYSQHLAHHSPLATFSKFLLSQENQAFTEPLINGNIPEPDYIKTEFTTIQFNALDSNIEDSNYYPQEDTQANNQNIIPTSSTSKTNNIQAKLKSKKTENSLNTQAKSQAKSRNKKNVTSSASTHFNKKVDELQVGNSSHKVTLLKPDEPPVAVDNVENYQANTSQSNILDNINPVYELINTPITEDYSRDENKVISDSISTVPSVESATIVHAANIPESITLSPQNTALEANENDSLKISSVEPPLTNIGNNFTLLSNLNNSDHSLIQEALPSVEVSDILINPTSQQQEVDTNPNILRQQEDLSHTNSDFAGIPNSATNLISNHLPEATKPRVEATPNLSHDLANVSEVPSAVSTPEISSGEIQTNVTVQLSPTSPVIADNPIITSEFQSRETVNFGDASESITPVQTDNASNIPVITNNPIVASQLQSTEWVNSADASASVTPLQIDSVNNVPVQLSPTSPVIVDHPIISSEFESAETVNFVDASASVTHIQTDSASNVSVQLAPTSPVITNNPIVASQLQSTEWVNSADASASVTPLQIDSVNNVPVQLSPTSPVIVDHPIIPSEFQSEEAVNFGDASESVTPIQTDSASNIPVQLAPTSPVITNNSIVASKSQSAESVNFVDASESVTPIQTDSDSNIPVQLAPTSPVITNNPIVASQLQSAESVNSADASESLVLSPHHSQPNTDIQTVVTPPVFRETIEVTQLDESAIASVTQPDLPPPQGFATGGQVTHTSVENPQIAASDTVPAMLTPGEFVINANDAQKNLHILRHINTGGTPEDIILPSLELPTPETPTKVDSFPDTSLQRQKSDSPTSEESNSLIPSFLGTEISQHRLSSHSSLHLNTGENKATARTEPHYSLPSLIFRQPSANTNKPYETPNQWSSVEELLNGNNDSFTSFNLNDGESNWQNSQFSEASPQVFPKRLTSPQSFANGGEVTAPDIARDIQPITETVDSPSANTPEADESANLEALAYEIYNRLRQRIEVERERQGICYGRLPW